MAAASIKVTFPRRQAMLSVREHKFHMPKDQTDEFYEYEGDEIARVPVFVWPNTTNDGMFVVEHQDGRCERVQPHNLTFLGSKELFDQWIWEEA